jgi:hypothetical protein
MKWRRRYLNVFGQSTACGLDWNPQLKVEVRWFIRRTITDSGFQTKKTLSVLYLKIY